ncbi:AAA family ATPase [Propionivibrio sp.]|uniref:AAA family ATPase n=1 Tax=Propionivibrio sp. TaxID=2212460 RepID=UPI003BEF6F61
MRIDRLDLPRYGKFTDASIDLPVAKRDFHLLVGANEAGKSTIRDAILDLLFGIEVRSTYDFLHPKAELRLGAAISHAGDVLDFQRVKKARSLLDAQGAVLADTALASFLGNADRNFFDHMFGLDHDRLVSGGNEILKASNDVGRILFQSAAGIGSLGAVRDALENEADKLWARRKSGERAYYAAAAELAAADSALKLAVVKTKDWAEARGSVEAIERELADLKQAFHTLETERTRLERIRRVALSVHAFAESSQELAALGEVPILPQDAAQSLATAETGIASAASQQRLARELADEARVALGQLAVDEAALHHAEAIISLAQRAQQTRFHERDIGRRQIEIEGHQKGLADAARQLGWPVTDDATIETRLPPLPARSAIAALIKRHGVIEQTLAAATEVEHAKKHEIAGITMQLDGLTRFNAAPELHAALDAAQGLGDFEANREREATRTTKAQRQLRSAERRLGQWRLDLSALRTLVLPAAESVRQQRNDFDRLVLDRRALVARKAELTTEIAALELEIEQFRHSRQAVTQDDLAAARNVRDGVWTAIKSGATTIVNCSADYENHVRNADGLSDKRHDMAQEAADLQARIDTLARQRLQLDTTGKQLSTIDDEIAAVERDWAAQAVALGFPDMPLLAYEEWRLAHAEVITAIETAEQTLAESAHLNATIEAARSRLHGALIIAGRPPAEGAGLDVLIKTARTLIDGATTTEARREELHRQRDHAEAALAGLSEKSSNAQLARNTWQASWTALLTKAGLAADAEVGATEGALTLFEVIDDKLKTIREIRKTRIETMRQDLEDFEREALALVQVMALELHGRGAADVALELSNRLAKARDDKKEAERLTNDCRRFEKQVAEGQERIDAAEASIAALLSTSGSTTRGELHEAIVRSDSHRSLTTAAEAARRAAEAGGDGLSLTQLNTEIESADIPQIAVQLGEITRELESARNHQAELAANLATAKAALGKIAGKDDAARAESARQDALARMADAVERYIKVHTAGRLLRWAIDRYRETRQGPMLARASEIFSGLTRGSFIKLVVDFECDPPTLDGMRPGGKTVGIAGMSDGTRDQLYLALRLAALEMHIGQAHALPFIADDLFINYDDDRARAGIEALAKLSETTQVIFLTHHEHLVPTVRAVFGEAANIVELHSR